MAKKDVNIAADTATDTEPDTVRSTPENTPVPGGGRWRWDATKPGWAEVDAEGATLPQPAEQPTSGE